MQEQQEQQEQAGAANTTPHPPFDVEWLVPVRYRARIDPSLPQFRGLTPADFPTFGTRYLSDAADAALEYLETEGNVGDVEDREVRHIAVSDGTEPGSEG